ncbi:HAD family hydrolase [Solibacillus sp. MA9]|uniref:HAD family hydrolase n=1 Tax=Solibacillus palustris TaxID=2908203 RepID=A0ABS9U9S5_9BACL|nr:HAD family hydrolase [Solibacillus sp. MA9]
MVEYEVVLFDLDGTIIDPKEGITKSVQYALGKMGVAVENCKALESFIGPPLQQSFKEQFGFSDHQANEAISYYRERYKPTGIYENTVYIGMNELLAELKSAGCRLAIATSKPTVFAQNIAEHYDFARYFDVIIGSELDGSRTLKAEVIEETLNQLGNPEISKCVMIGDRKYDIIGAKTNDMESVGVEFGYGSKQELAEANATYIVQTVAQLRDVLMK